jgi:hypothetical protein
MFRLLAALLIIGQFVLVGSGLIWLVGKVGFKSAKPYAAKVEQTFHTVKASIL